MTGCRPGFVTLDHRTVTFRNARDRTRERSSVGGHQHCAHDHLMRPCQTLLLLGHSSGCTQSCLSQYKPLGTSTPMNSAQVPSAHRGGHRTPLAVVMGGKRREGGSIWIHAVFRRSHGLCCFSMIRTARRGAMMVMRQRYNDHFSSSYAPISVPRRLRKVGCQG